jgi:hypothetical protein
MILENMDFTDFYTHIRNIFSNYFTAEETDQIMEYVDILSDANFRCYKANMIVIETRKKEAWEEHINVDKLIADMEWVARSVGEYRVSSKARINKYISMIRPKIVNFASDSWTSDDVVYSIGEMMDRLSIETIKREDFRVNTRPQHMTDSCQELSDRVEKYLKAKLVEIDDRGYECVHEQRTYDLEGIVKDLAI